ncbi:hypothetical protein Rsub_11805 [Raphidocelis subcapitata]|uniref:Leucine-rich repeat-containing N-terminal plant-type domain-containing protein n=1 Tax=Raphidocelis subcapitata TaxID=307507 RepID=A0A2V0PGQ0_9CHLO|nr:hypothetical protein Rsub_11805 [Raphidocelis subcapitata]|eukprot:GBF99001.1 hypothetical protein Rsub_11805 [Raphidocelis subcapitata]
MTHHASRAALLLALAVALVGPAACEPDVGPQPQPLPLFDFQFQVGAVGASAAGSASVAPVAVQVLQPSRQPTKRPPLPAQPTAQQYLEPSVMQEQEGPQPVGQPLEAPEPLPQQQPARARPSQPQLPRQQPPPMQQPVQARPSQPQPQPLPQPQPRPAGAQPLPLPQQGKPAVAAPPSSQLDALLAAAAALAPRGGLRGWTAGRGAGGGYCAAFDGVRCDGARNVVGIDLGKAGPLGGALPPGAVLRALPKLRSLWLPSAALAGALPADWGGLSELEDVRLGGNALEGGVPHAWTNMGGLKRLDLS